jgi:maleate isomerase
MDAITEKENLAAAHGTPRAHRPDHPLGQPHDRAAVQSLCAGGLGVYVARGRVAGQPRQSRWRNSPARSRTPPKHWPTPAPDLIVFHCTHTSMKEGTDGEARIIASSEKTTGIKALSTSSLVNDALRAARLEKACGAQPYMSNANIISYLGAAGFTVVKDVALKCRLAADFEAVTPQRWLELARENDTPEADGIFLSCTNTTQIEAVTAIEQALGKPVVNSNQAVLWGCLKRLKDKLGDKAEIPELGRLMRDLDA